MPQREGPEIQQQYHELLADARELLLLLIPLPHVSLIYEIIFGAIEALILEADGRSQDFTQSPGVPEPEMADVTWSHINELLNEEHSPAQVNAPGPRPGDRALRQLDPRVTTAITALRKALADARQTAKILSATNPQDPSWGQIYHQLGQLLTIIRDQSNDISRIINERNNVVSAPQQVPIKHPSTGPAPRTPTNRLPNKTIVAREPIRAPGGGTPSTPSMFGPSTQQAPSRPGINDGRGPTSPIGGP